jgi:hypothetical protein
MSGCANAIGPGSNGGRITLVHGWSRRREYPDSVGAVDEATAVIALVILTAVVGVLCLWYVHERQVPVAGRGMRPPPPPLTIDAGPRPPPHRTTIDVSSVAYRMGYGDVYYSAAHPYQGVPGMRPTDPNYNVYLRTPRSEWRALANRSIHQGTKGVEQDCGAFGPPGKLRHMRVGDWQDNHAGFDQALQDIAAGRAPWTTTPSGYAGDVGTCD